MTIEKTVKDLQAQNAQFQQMFMASAQGQEDLKALVIKEKKKKKAKKPVGVAVEMFKIKPLDWLDFIQIKNKNCHRALLFPKEWEKSE